MMSTATATQEPPRGDPAIVVAGHAVGWRIGRIRGACEVHLGSKPIVTLYAGRSGEPGSAGSLMAR